MRIINISLKKSCLIAGIVSFLESLIISFYFGIQINAGKMMNGALAGEGVFKLSTFFIPAFFIMIFINFLIFIFVCKWQGNKK